MRRIAGGIGRLAAALALGLLDACQPLPHPFADDRPPASLIMVRDSFAISVARVDGQPEKTAAKLSEAVAKALRDHEIPASDKSVSPGSHVLDGRIEARPAPGGKMAVSVTWQLRDGKGETVGERRERLEGPARKWRDGDDATVAKLAAKSAAALAAMLQDEPAPVEVAGGGRIRVAVGNIKGAPGDGSHSLASAVSAVLKRQDVALVEDGKTKPDLLVDADVTVVPAKPDKQHVKIVWRVRKADGGEVGTVALENDVPRGLLDGAWGDLAYTVAVAAGSGLGELLARGAPPARTS